MAASSAETGPWTVSRLLTWTRDCFERQEVEPARLCAEILLAHAMNCPRIQLYTQHDTVPDEQVLERFRTTVRAAATGRPIAYLVGTKEFFSLSFEVTPDVLIPRPESEILVERTIDLVRRSGRQLRTILDLGTGSGCIVVSLAKHLPDVRLYASDISAPAVAVARRNAEQHGVAERITFARGDLFAPWPSRGPVAAEDRAGPPPFDLIVCNPPYVATAPDTPVADDVRDFEPRVALFAGPDGLDIIRRIAVEAPQHLRPDGHLLMETAFDQAPAVRGLLAQAGWQDLTTYRDGAGHERVIHARRPATDRLHSTRGN